MKRHLLQIRYIGILLFVLLSGCASKEPLSPQVWSQMENKVTNHSFKFVAHPPDIGKNNDMPYDSSPGYLIMQGDSVQTYLGYYGRRTRNKKGQSVRGLFFEGEASRIIKIKHFSRQYYELRFNLIQPGVILECRLKVFPDYSGLLTIYNITRDYRIRRKLILNYKGEIQRMENPINM